MQETNKITIDKILVIKASLFIIAILFVLFNSLYGFALVNTNIESIYDRSFEITGGINSYLKTHVTIKKLLILFSSLCVDSIILIILIDWVIRGKSWRIILSLIIFYGIRSLVQVKLNNKSTCFK